MAIIDNQNLFSDSQAVTATAASTNSIDLGPLFGNQLIALGSGEPLAIVVNTAVAMTDAGSDSTVTVTLEMDADPLFGSPTVVATLGTFAAASAAGVGIIAYVPPAYNFEQYIQLRYTVAGGNLTTGSFDARLTKDFDSYKHYKHAYIIS